ncbi:porin [Rhizobium sp. AC27/96]|uniref:porin n=1 Tax=Rhizobium TaxID=379 RepID=UPI000828DC1B|nr:MULTISPECIES: porin [Rhizobium]NTF41422.1 porin [Rhizobium rhizogenes]OCJ11830.1 porin [Rhizobium sp. AC27/96]
MNIKSLLLGSAAALAAVSGAHAADAIVAAEPEPLEYVRICDAYGAGYFFIPGTETCLKVGGQVRTEGGWYNAYKAGQDESARGTYWHTRAELRISTASDTEYGPLKTSTVYRWDWNDGGATTSKLLWANISLGGFLVGKNDSVYSTFLGYAGDVINDDVIEYGINGTDELNQLTYTYDAGNGFTAVISLEDSNSGTGAKGANGEDSSDHYAPDVVAGAGYKAGAWQFRVVGGYDSIVEEGAVKARIDADFGVLSAFIMGGYNTDGSKLNKYAGAGGAGIGWGDWALWGGASVPINEKLKWNVQLAYDDLKTFSATTNLKFNPVKDLLVEPEVTYTNYDSVNKDTWAGILRFQRVF